MSGAGVESDEEVMQGDFRFSQIHRVLGGRAVVNPQHLVEICTRNLKAQLAVSQPSHLHSQLF